MSGVGPRAERAVLLLRRGFEHLETLVTRGGGLAPHENGRNLLSEFRGTRPLSAADYMTPRAREFIQSLHKEQREVLFRLLPVLIKQGRGEDLRFVGSVVSAASARVEYEYLEALILHTQDLPGARERTLRYTQRWHYSFRSLDSPRLREYLDRLEKAGNADVKAAVADMRKQIPAVSPWSRKTPEPNQPKPVFWDDGSWDPPSRVALRPLTFTIVGREGQAKGQQPVVPVGLLAAGPRVDVVWNANELFLMREPGKLESVWSSGTNRHVFVHSAAFDGRFVWAVVRPAAQATTPTLLVIDPVVGKVKDVSGAEGLPQAGDRGQTLVLAPLGPRRVAVAGGFGRAWVGVITFDADAGKASVRVIHEARELQETSAKDRGGRTTVGFTPTFLFVLRGADGTGPACLLVGRGAPAPTQGSINHEVVARPLVVDADTGDATVLDGPMWGERRPVAFAAHGGAVSFLDIDPATGRLGLARVSAPGRKAVVARDVPIPQDPQIQLLFHDGRIHVVRHEPGSQTVQRGSEWWVADPDGRRVRLIASDLPPVDVVAASAHHGVVAWTSHLSPLETRVNAVEFVNLPPADPAREPPVGLTPEDPERVAAKLTPVELSKDPATDMVPQLAGLTAVGPGVDVAWGSSTLYLMTEKGKLRRVWNTEDLNSVFTAVCYDGRYVWATARRLQKSPLLLVLDPKTGKVTTVEGLPDPVDDPKDRGRLRTLLLTALGPGRACVVGSSDRTWVAVVAFDADAGKATAKVVHTAADPQDAASDAQWHSPTVSFTPTFLVAVRGEPGAGGVSPYRVLIGRGEPLPNRGKYNTRVALHPLLVDPDRGTAEVPDFTVIQRQQGEFATAGGAVLFVEQNVTRTGTFQFRRIGFPGVNKETTAPRVAAGPVVVHGGRVRIVTDLWWPRDTDGEPERRAPGDAPWFRGFAPSSHYGLVTVAELRGGFVVPCAAEFADLPP